jgi:hypothetical protein
MNFNKIIRKLGMYQKKPEIHLKTLKEVVKMFYDSMSGLEQEQFIKRCVNKNFDLFKLLNLTEKQESLDKYFKHQEKMRFN